MKTVLISGASIAGPALAYWLHHHGFAPTIVERSPDLRAGGQAIDVRGVALDVVDRMGIGTQLRAARTRMRGMSMLDGEGNEIHRSTDSTFSSGQLDNEDVELLREDLTHLLYERTRTDTEYVFNDSITALTESESGIRTDFEHAPPRTFDLVVGADGLHSHTRALTFGPEDDFIHHLGTHLAIFSAENFLGLDNWQMWLREGSAGYGIYPVRDNTELRIAAGFEAPPLADGYDYRDTDRQKALVADALDDLGWETPRLLEAMHAAPDFYFDSMAQIRMDSWSKGRVTLLGDAGYCASPLSGQGTSLALVGAYVLAEELGRNPDAHHTAYARTEDRMRPFIALENPGGPATQETVDRAKSAIDLDAGRHLT
ncbi:FAD-dependent monooxygenase [Streptomyces sp. H27-C3]|uniref:FAD-dependent monooxygenase n=1 Tax=Streptomyces sp. H27-C3 TaxID=3046305 RepID=UPI0024BA1F72|nr:FAD-dependent monooxygenase [Streptomyces sp. H27-C3]MDJ0463573.1 FAD-dependent monooxygenase [Streptomyces sp. H27-C3]